MSDVEIIQDVDEDVEEEEEEEQLTIVEDDPDGGEPDDKKGDDKDEARLGGGRDDEDEDKGKKSRRRTTSERNASRRKAKERTDREMGFLRHRNEQLERRFSQLETDVDARVTGSEIANVDQALTKSKSDLQLANQVIAQAIEKQDGSNITEALGHRDNIRDNIRDLEEAKEYLTDEDNRRTAAPAMKLDPRHVAHAQSFMVDNDWWDPLGRDTDSKLVLDIDTALVGEGYNPVTKDYWDELRQRVEKDLPHHFDAGGDEDDDDDKDTDTDKGNGRKTRRSRGPQFRTGGRERPLKKGEVYISAERKEAMIERGVWEDPVLRNKFLKAYAKWDEEERGSTDAR